MLTQEEARSFLHLIILSIGRHRYGWRANKAGGLPLLDRHNRECGNVSTAQPIYTACFMVPCMKCNADGTYACLIA